MTGFFCFCSFLQSEYIILQVTGCTSQALITSSDNSGNYLHYVSVAECTKVPKAGRKKRFSYSNMTAADQPSQ